jgi:hypothetical protein
MYRIQMRYTDMETGYLEQTWDQSQAEVYSVFYYLPGRGSLSYHIDDFETPEQAEECINQLVTHDEYEHDRKVADRV